MDIRGEWFNELRSRMNITEITYSIIRGTYESKVGHAKGEYPLCGRISVPADNNRTIAFVVTWQNGQLDTDAVTAWSEEAREVDGKQYITTTWLITGETNPKDDWSSTLIGKDRFSRIPPTDQEFALALALRASTHRHLPG